MRSVRSAPLLVALLLASLLACSTNAPVVVSAASDCSGLTAPKVITAPGVNLPSTLTSAHVGMEMPGELVVGRDGAVTQIHLPGAEFAFLVPYADQALQHTRFSPASIEGNTVATRLPVIVPVGLPRKARADAVPSSLRAFVPGAESREARWQLRDSVQQLTLAGHVGILAAPGGTIVAIAPGGAEKVFVTVVPSTAPQEIRQIVKTGKFLSAAGDYRFEIRAGKNVLTFTTVTIAEDYKQAIVNACEPVIVSRKIGPGN